MVRHPISCVVVKGCWYMAKGQQRGNREAKKPKKEKPKTPQASSPFAQPTSGAGERGGRKK